MTAALGEPEHDHGELPWVVVVREQSFFTSARFLEDALSEFANVITVPINISEWFPDFGFSSRVGRFLLVRKNTIELNLERWVFPRKVSDIDLVLVVDPVRFHFVFKSFQGKTAFYAIDPHNPHIRQEHVTRTKVREYDIVYCAQRDFVDFYRGVECPEVLWLPHACDPKYHRPGPGLRKYDIASAGTPYTERARLLKLLSERFQVEKKADYLHELGKLYGSAKIVFNKSGGGDVNIRVFEATGCGALLLTDSVGNGLRDLFDPDKEIAVYRDEQEMMELATNFLADEENRERVAYRGFQRAHREHTFQHRARTILQWLDR